MSESRLLSLLLALIKRFVGRVGWPLSVSDRGDVARLWDQPVEPMFGSIRWLVRGIWDLPALGFC